MTDTILLIDNFDSFSYMLADYLMQTGVTCEVRRNDDRALLHLDPKAYLALVISPGPGRPEEAGLLMEVLPNWVNCKPILGVCLGHQAIGIYFGAKLVKAKLPRHGKVDGVAHKGDLLFEGVPNDFFATRYHSLILEEFPYKLEAICACENEIMGLVHKELPVYGIQFHPESCQTPEGIKMIKNFIDLAKRIAQN
ncbi:MAG: aminodeoxychorismate/anthranilate synthase component II [bacterium]|nr:aminodeoxychorismate/anthranilate synthase component II [bacterium]